jgi:hypothetical protein
MTKKVIDINSKKIVDVPENHIECSVCGKWEDPSHYKKESESVQSRTNCTSCYNLPWDDMQSLGAQTKEMRSSPSMFHLRQKLTKMYELADAAVPVYRLIEALQKLPAGSKVCMTQDGYYAEGGFALLGNTPSEFELIGDDMDGTPVYSIGHSSQNY